MSAATGTFIRVLKRLIYKKNELVQKRLRSELGKRYCRENNSYVENSSLFELILCRLSLCCFPYFPSQIFCQILTSIFLQNFKTLWQMETYLNMKVFDEIPSKSLFLNVVQLYKWPLVLLEVPYLTSYCISGWNF